MSKSKQDMGGLPELWFNCPPDIVEFYKERTAHDPVAPDAELSEYTVIISGTSTGILGERAQRPPMRRPKRRE